MIPPLMSSTLNGKDILPGSKEADNAQAGANKAAQQVKSATTEKQMGRPEKSNE